MRNILLINPQPVVLKNLFAESIMYVNPPMGLGYLGSALRNKGFNVTIFDMGAQQLQIKDIFEKIEKYDVPVIAISSFIANHGNGMRIAKAVKEKYPQVKVIMGGPQASFIAKEVLQAGDVDVVSMFEGEITIPELVDALIKGTSLEKILGIAYRNGEEVVFTPERPKIENLDEIAYPAWDLFDLSKYAEPGVILTGRGCPYKCIFCSASVVSGARYRMRSVKNVVDEIEYLNKEFGINQIFMADDTFTADKNHCIAICREIRRRKLNIRWEAEARANTVTDEVVSEMAKAGCTHVQIGAESGDNEILKTIGKNVTTRTIERAVQTFLKHGITVVCSFILGNPEDTLETIKRTINFAIYIKNLAPNLATCKFSLLTPLPGTPVYENREKLGIEITTDNWDKYTFFDPVIRTKNFSEKDLQNIYLKTWINYVKGEEKDEY